MRSSILGVSTCLALLVPSVGWNCGATYVVGSDDGGLDSGGSGGGSGSSSGGGSGSSSGGGVSDGWACVADGISFALTVDTTDTVCTQGSTPPWPSASFGCPSWLTISGPDGSSLNLVSGGCFALCPAAEPEPAKAQSFKWDGTYYPTTNPSNPNTACDTPTCAPAGNYVATLCVGYASQDAGTSGCYDPNATDGSGAPTCKQVPFVWPPTSANLSIDETITPTPPDGG